MLYTDIYKPKKDDFISGKLSGIIITHSADLFEVGEMISSARFDTYKPAFPTFSKYSYNILKENRFPSHYFIEQIEEEICTIVGTSEHLISPFLRIISGNYKFLDNFILIVISGDYSFDLVPKDMYIRLGQVISSILYRNKIVGKYSAVYTLTDIIEAYKIDEIELKKRNLNISPMKFFNKSDLKPHLN